jgi:cysteine desulfurase
MPMPESPARIYLDHAATSPVRPEVEEAMRPLAARRFGNPSSLHEEGRRAREVVEEARMRVARAIGARGDEIVFTSGGTEADNLAVLGVARSSHSKGRHVVSTAIEHHAVLHAVEALADEGFETRLLPVDREGRVSVEALEAALRPDTALVSVMWANNEAGTIQPIAEIAALCRRRGVPFHTDAVQAFGKLPIDVRSVPVDLLSISAHKIGGPKGVGALYVRRGLKLRPLLFGGPHEFSRRAGTENVAGIVGLGVAVELAARDVAATARHLADLVSRFLEALRAAIPGVRIHSPLPGEGGLPGIVNVAFEGAEGESLVLHLDRLGVAASPGSACTAEDPSPSHVLRAMGLRPEEARGSVRFSFGRENIPADVAAAVAAVRTAVDRLRSIG